MNTLSHADEVWNATPGERWTASSLFALAVLLLALLLSTNLQIQTLLVEPIRKELRLSDLQLGQLHGLTVLVFGALAAFPIGWLADRWDRRHVVALCVLGWSGAIYLVGLAPTAIGALSDRLAAHTPNALLLATVAVTALTLLLGVLLMARCEGRYLRLVAFARGNAAAG